MRTLHADGLVLEPQCARHADGMFGVLADSALYRHEGAPPASAGALRERFARLESRRSPAGDEQWLNWVLRLPSNRLAGFVQATVHPRGRATIAYVLASEQWGRGLATRAVLAMLDELRAAYGVRVFEAVVKSGNQASLRLLGRLGFERVDGPPYPRADVDDGECLLRRDAGQGPPDLPGPGDTRRRPPDLAPR